jgi:hypothetical protein
MNGKKCIRCSKCEVTTTFAEAPPEACPSCGAIFGKLETTIAARANARLKPSAAAKKFAVTPGAFIETLRAKSNYPTFRAVTSVIHVIGQIMALLALLFGVFGGHGPRGIITGVVTAIVLHLAFRFGKEATLMLADLTDAAVTMAQRDSASP